MAPLQLIWWKWSQNYREDIAITYNQTSAKYPIFKPQLSETTSNIKTYPTDPLNSTSKCLLPWTITLNPIVVNIQVKDNQIKNIAMDNYRTNKISLSTARFLR